MTSLSVYTATVLEEWVDYNGHMSEAYYVLVFGYATDAAMDALGLGDRYRTATNRSLYTVEAHVRYLREVGLGAQLDVTTDVVNATDKKLHLVHTMRHDGAVMATEELLGIHVNRELGAAESFPGTIRDAARNALIDPPEWSGRRVSV